MANQLTTAQTLGTYQRALLREGINPDTVQTLVIEAARRLLMGDVSLAVEDRFECDSCREVVDIEDEGPTGSDGSRHCQDCYAEAV